MRTLLFTSVAALLMCVGCSDMVSLNGFSPEALRAQNPALPGVWAGDDSLYIVKEKQGGYSISIVSVEKNEPAVNFTASLIRAGNAEILDLVPASDDSAFHIPVHTPVRIWVDEHRLKFAFLDSEWLREKARASLASEKRGSRLLITSAEAAVFQFLLVNGTDDRAYTGKLNELVRQ
jgi:hypothetical protein